MDEPQVERLRRAIEQAVGSTIENMAFSVVDAVAETTLAEDDAVCASLKVVEPTIAEIRLVLPLVTARALARLLYNIEDGAITGDMLRDVAGELLNTIGGAVMRAVLPPDTRFELGLPEIGRGGFPVDSRCRCTCSFSIDGMPLTVMVEEQLATL